MFGIDGELEGKEPDKPKSEKLLSFKTTGRVISPDAVEEEFELMNNCLKKPLTAEIASRICGKSGTHLLKLVSPRADGDHAVLRFEGGTSNRRSPILPSTNAPDIPFCKVVYRPLEIVGHSSRSVVDHVLNSDEDSSLVLDAFAKIFGDDVFKAMQEALLSNSEAPLKLGAGEFPIIFIPKPGGGDLQITPVSPATAFMGMKRVTDPYFQKTQPEGLRLPRGRWIKQAISSKPQNISGAIGGPRVRFLATMPPSMAQGEAELYRYVNGGSFPRWKNEEITIWVLRYADMLESDVSYNNQNTRAALDRIANQLIEDAAEFISDISRDAKNLANHHGIPEKNTPEPPGVVNILIRRRWATNKAHDRARKVLTSPHFEDQIRKRRDCRRPDHA